eukprot:c5935_g1_i1 orf=324-530(+)
MMLPWYPICFWEQRARNTSHISDSVVLYISDSSSDRRCSTSMVDLMSIYPLQGKQYVLIRPIDNTDMG